MEKPVRLKIIKRVGFFVHGGTTLTVVLSLVVVVLVVVAAVTDLQTHKIPNKLTFPAMGIGVIGHGVIQGWAGVAFSLEGLGLGFLLLFGFYLMGGMAAGDVKLMAAVGSFLGPINVFLVFLMTALLGGLYALGMMIHESGVGGMLSRLGLIVKTFFLTGSVKTAFSAGDPHQKKLRYGLVIGLGTLGYQFWYWVGVG